MEEVKEPGPPPTKKPRPADRPVIDLGNLGVPVDPSGRIVPLLYPGGPAVMPNFSRLEVEYTPPAVYVPYMTFRGPFSYLPRYTPFGTYMVPVYQAQQNLMAVPMGIPRYYSSSSDDPQATRTTGFQFSGSVLTPGTGASVWSRSWRSPWGGAAWLPQLSSFEQTGTIRSFFPQEASQAEIQP